MSGESNITSALLPTPHSKTLWIHHQRDIPPGQSGQNRLPVLIKLLRVIMGVCIKQHGL